MNKNELSIKMLFEKNRSSLSEELNGLSHSLEKDVSIIVGNFLKRLTADHREILNSVQVETKFYENLPNLLSCFAQPCLRQNKELQVPQNNNSKTTYQLPTRKMYILLAITIIAGVTGGLIFNNWIGSLVLSVLSLGIAFLTVSRSSEHHEEEVKERMLDTEEVMVRTQKLCEIIDDITAEYRLQIEKIENECKKHQAKPFEVENQNLLEHIQSLIGYERYKRNESDYVEELQDRCEDITEVLSNEGLSFVDYSEGDADKFEVIEIDNINTLVKVYPAIVKDNSLITKGRVFVPKQ